MSRRRMVASGGVWSLPGSSGQRQELGAGAAGCRVLRVWLALLVLAAFEFGTVRAASGATCREAAASVTATHSAASDEAMSGALALETGAAPTDPSEDSVPAQPAAGSCPGASLAPGERVRTGDVGPLRQEAVPAVDERAGPEMVLPPPFHPPRTI